MYRAGYPVGRLTTILLIATLFFSVPTQAAENAMLDLDLSALMQIQVTSAGRKEQNLKDIPAAVFVIDQDDIRNSGVTSIPEALRMVPGIQVARITSSKWAISSRGFNGTFSNKLLVQLDGRSVYSPTYSGVYWDIQQVVLEDVERIEVIRGPGATLWGANAVNGIINIITKQSSDTQGTMLSVGGGNHEDSMASLRHGFQLGDDVYGRFFLSRHYQDSYQLLSDKTDAYDDWNITHGGFRLDGDQGIADSWTFQGDGYQGDSHQIVDNYWLPGATFPLQVKDTTDVAGFNLLGRWTHRFTERSSSTLQTYFDQTTREDIYLQQKQHTFDVDFQHRYQPGTRNDLIWGLGYRTITDDIDYTYQY